MIPLFRFANKNINQVMFIIKQHFANEGLLNISIVNAINIFIVLFPGGRNNMSFSDPGYDFY